MNTAGILTPSKKKQIRIWEEYYKATFSNRTISIAMHFNLQWYYNIITEEGRSY